MNAPSYIEQAMITRRTEAVPLKHVLLINRLHARVGISTAAIPKNDILMFVSFGMMSPTATSRNVTPFDR